MLKAWEQVKQFFLANDGAAWKTVAGLVVLVGLIAAILTVAEKIKKLREPPVTSGGQQLPKFGWNNFNYNQALQCMERKDYRAALAKMELAQEDHKDPDNRDAALINIYLGYLYNELAQYKTAIEKCFDPAVAFLKQSKKKKDRKALAAAYNNTGCAYSQQGRLRRGAGVAREGPGDPGKGSGQGALEYSNELQQHRDGL
ncbi:MAG: hypothetical protein LBJ11_04290 [Oscillospiraceae bacterium]|jgi:tetratricopeptide (TPR) repeat protein|nr:hypothetical protein [Oscillospiraceae bacterium]